MRFEPSLETDRIAHNVIGAAIAVHRALGPGFVESIYERALALELTRRTIPFASQAIREVRYLGEVVGEHRLDFIVDHRLVVELKAVSAIDDRHVVQVLSYLRATDLELALIINFNVKVLRDGIKRVIPCTIARDAFLKCLGDLGDLGGIFPRDTCGALDGVSTVAVFEVGDHCGDLGG